MTWVMTSRRIQGSVGRPPSVMFAVGGIHIADIVMRNPDNEWGFALEFPVPSGLRSVEFKTFSEALKHLHEVLNGEPPTGFEIFKSNRS